MEVKKVKKAKVIGFNLEKVLSSDDVKKAIRTFKTILTKLKKERNNKMKKHYGVEIDYPTKEEINDAFRNVETVEEAYKVFKDLFRKFITAYKTTKEWEERKEERETFYDKVVDFGDKGVVLVEYTLGVGVHPSPEDFRPYLIRTLYDKKRRRKVYHIQVSYDDSYESSKHLNVLRKSKEEYKKTEKGWIGYVEYHLYRRRLDFGRHRDFAFLFGIDDGSWFVDRVPVLGNINEVIEWMKPSEVKKAEKEGRKVYRQGDVFFVELKGRKKTIFDYLDTIPDSHKVVEEGEKVIIKHGEHSELVLPHKYFKPVIRKTLTPLVRRGRFVGINHFD